MENKKLGQEAAFPLIDCADGMSKRFYAACVAMQGLCANPKNSKINSNLFTRIMQLFFPKTNISSTIGNCEDMVKIAYNMADELLKQENK